jgi:hypothetical protein
MARKHGNAGKLYRNSATYATPTFVEVANIRDMSIDDARAEADLSARGDDISVFLAGKRTVGVQLEMVYDDTDTGYDALRDAYEGNTVIELWIADGPAATTGSTGPRGWWIVSSLSRAIPFEDGMMATVTLRPAANAANAMTTYTKTA